MDIKKLKKQALNEIEKTKIPEELEQFRVKYLGRKKGKITKILRSLKNMPSTEKKRIGPQTNKLKKEIDKAIKERNQKIESSKDGKEGAKIDITAPGIRPPHGHLHPITQIKQKVEKIFLSMGFKVIEGPDIETDYYNFDALNIPKDHPARDVWDTFWLKAKADESQVIQQGRHGSKRRLAQKEELLLRTHTSPMQVRYMEKNNPPFRIIVPGRCFRYEATNASHSHTFYQIEGLMVDRNINIANFRAIIEGFLKKLFGENIKIRIRPSYFPFTEPSLEIDIYKEGKWLEIMGAGMVHPNVFKAAGYVPDNWQGFAFGMGLDRIVMMKYKINDIRLLYSGNLKFLEQF